MDAKSIRRRQEVDDEDGIWKYVFGFTEMAVVKCAIELGIPDFLESQQQAVTLDQLSSALGCSPSALYRIMRFLINRGIFKEVEITPTITTTQQATTRGYVQTPLSALLTRDGEKSMAAFVRLESSPVMLAPWLKLSGRVLLSSSSSSSGDNNNLHNCSSSDAFEAANGKDVWRYAESDPAHSKLIEDAMACHARMAVPAIIEACPDLLLLLLHGGVVVDVGGGDGTTVEMLVKAFPGVKGINFDLPHVVSVAPKRPGVHHVGGNMFQRIPKADAVFLMWVLHDWGDEECIQILSKCREAIPEETAGKVIIAEAILTEDHQEIINGYELGTIPRMKNNTNTKNSKLQEKDHNNNNNNNNSYEVGLMLDMVMMAHTGNGLERTEKQWSHVLTAAGFKSYTVTPTSDVVSIIQAWP
nr:(RS)-norcoclaurine 6-O-methyltransferase-like [Ipomoea batatas]